jgi:hypothetical protein
MVNILENIIPSDFTDTEISLKEFSEIEEIPNNFFIFSDEINTNYKISEEEINKNRLNYLDKKITPLFLSLIKYEDFDFGHSSESIKLVEEQIAINKIATQNWLNGLYIKYFSSDEKVLIGLLRIIEFIDVELLSPTAETIALASLSNKNDEIKELGIRFFENWISIDSLNILNNLEVESVWLQKYIDQVKKDLEIELCLY